MTKPLTGDTIPEAVKHAPPSRTAFDAIVVGSGVNGLTSAAYLADAGLDVLVLEAKDRLGGALVTSEVTADFLASSCAHVINGMPSRIAKDLKLGKFGLKFAAKQLQTIAPDGEGRAVKIGGKSWQSLSSLQAISEQDAVAYQEFSRRMEQFSSVLQAFIMTAPPAVPVSNVARSTWSDTLQALQRFGPELLPVFLKTLVAAAGDVFDEYFEGDLLKGALSADAVLGSRYGPRQSSSMIVFLMNWAQRGLAGKGAMAVPHGGMGALSDALAAAARSKGAVIRTAAPVVSVAVKNGRASGVELATGELFTADRILSSASPRSTFLDLVGPQHLDTEFVRHIRQVKTEGTSAKINLALSELPNFTGLETDDLAARLVISPSIDYAERACDGLKYDNFAGDPVLEILFPSVHDYSLTTLGQHVMSIVVQGAPYRLEGGWVNRKDEYVNRMIDVLAYYAPDIREKIIAGQILTPPEIERDFGVAGAHWHQNDLSLERLLGWRPVGAAGRYNTPIKGLYLCGAGAHPGGGITGLPGYHASRTVIAEIKTDAKVGAIK